MVGLLVIFLSVYAYLMFLKGAIYSLIGWIGDRVSSHKSLCFDGV